MTTPIHIRGEYHCIELSDIVEGISPAMEAGSSDAIRYYQKNYRDVHDTRRIQLPPGSWQIVCTSKECTREHADQIVEKIEEQFYKDYEYKGGIFTGPLPSLHSLLRSKGLDPDKTLILKKV